MNFKNFKKRFQQHVADTLKNQNALFIVDVDKDILWNTYLNSFPAGTNEIYRERREHDCSCCRHFVKSFGNVVVLKDNAILTMWDFDSDSPQEYQPVINALSNLIKNSTIKDVFVTHDSIFGTDKNHEQLEDGTIKTWEHFQIKLPKQFVSNSSRSIGDLTGELRDTRNVFKRSLEEISKDSIETVLELISQKSLYKGDEWHRVLYQFLSIHNEYHNLKDELKENYCWSKSIEVGSVIGKIKNHSIGVLLSDITDGMDLNTAVKRYEKIVAPMNYKRPKAIFTKKMIEQAQKTITELGLMDSLGRRHAVLEDITINNILFANRDTAKKMTGNPFDELKMEVSNPKKFDRIEEISIEQFINDILPTTTSIELMLENKHASNMVSLIAPQIQGSKSMFKWDNNFSWAYNGNITDSMKQRVKAAGGNVDGVLRFSIQWNDGEDNHNDFDAHCIEPRGNHIYFGNKGRQHASSGMLDVDIQYPEKSVPAVENITWTNKNKMPNGRYEFYVHNYSHNGGRTGFAAEIEYDGQIYSYEYPKELKQGENVTVAVIEFSRENGIKFIKSLPSTTASRKVWGIDTNQFHPVSVMMMSPNYWDDQTGIGNKHYFFIINGCKNEDRPNGFFNEFLRQEFTPHKHVFEALGAKMRVEQSEDQLSGLGFSSTQRNTVLCKIEGHTTRTIKINF